MTQRRILRLTGADTLDFLQGLITNDIHKLSQGLVYAAILTPQGKFIADFFLVADGDAVLLDAASDQADMLLQRLAMYKLRAKVEITNTDLNLHRGLGDTPADGFADPRHPGMGWRAYRDTPQTDDTTDWDALRVAHGIPETGIELTSDSYILEMGFARLNGVDFRKGCYVGQEVTARMKHKTELRKGLATISVQGSADIGTDILNGKRAAGKLLTRSGDRALAYLRFDRAAQDMTAGDADVQWDGQT